MSVGRYGDGTGSKLSFNNTANNVIYTRSLRDALPITRQYTMTDRDKQSTSAALIRVLPRRHHTMSHSFHTATFPTSPSLFGKWTRSYTMTDIDKQSTSPPLILVLPRMHHTMSH